MLLCTDGSFELDGRWIDILPDVTYRYNRRTHRAHGCKPFDVWRNKKIVHEKVGNSEMNAEQEDQEDQFEHAFQEAESLVEQVSVNDDSLLDDHVDFEITNDPKGVCDIGTDQTGELCEKDGTKCVSTSAEGNVRSAVNGHD